MAMVAAVTLSACGSQGAGKSETRESPSMTPLGDVCEGIFDPETTAEAEKLLGSDRVSSDWSSRGAAQDASSKAARILSRGMDRRYAVNSTCIFKKKPDSGRYLHIWFEWMLIEFDQVSAEGRLKGTSAAYQLDDGALTRLFVDCERPDLVKPGGKKNLLKVVISDPIGFSQQSRVRLLNASAKKVVTGLKCKNKVILPEVDVVIPENPRLK
ncbi:hypothetical protein ABID95_002409 [Streptomyces atratus]|uniref:hypothetical protein n=1 Tax=Streptomyces atratus TaxID=1893 RepID=UPI0033914D24